MVGLAGLYETVRTLRMHIFIKIKKICLLFLFGYLSGCGDSSSDNEIDSELSGTWYFVTESETGVEEYHGKHILNQKGDDVVISYCRGYSTVLKLDGDQLFNEDGSSYYLSVVDNQTLSGPNDVGGTSVVKKLSEKQSFDDGSFSLASHLIEDFESTNNVCATIRSGRFSCGADKHVYPNKLEIKSDYRNGYVFLSIAFNDINVGTYDVVEFCDFVDSDASNVYVELESLEFESFLGTGVGLSIVSGSITLDSTDENEFILSGLLISREGYEFRFSALVDISDPENS